MINNIKNLIDQFGTRGYLRDLIKLPLFYNAWYILGVNIAPALIGFLFWKACSYYFLPSDIGIGAAILSAAGLVTNLSNMGVNISIVRYLPSTKNTNSLLNTSLSLTLLASISFTFIFITGIPIWSPKLLIIKKEPVFFISFSILIISTAIGTFLRGVFVARRRSIFAFIYTALANVIGLMFLFIFIAYPIHGILISNTIGYTIALIISCFFLIPVIEKSYEFRFEIDKSVLKSLLPYSFSNYIATFLFLSYQTIFPLIVLNFLGSDASGVIYVVLMIFGGAISPGLALGYSAFSEGSNNIQSGASFFRKATYLGVGVTILISLMLFILTRWVLLIFGTNYSQEGTSSLLWLTIAAPFMVINQIYAHLLRFKDRSKELILMNLSIFILSIGISIYLLPLFGLSAVSIGLLSANLIVILALSGKIVQNLFKEQSINI